MISKKLNERIPNRSKKVKTGFYIDVKNVHGVKEGTTSSRFQRIFSKDGLNRVK